LIDVEADPEVLPQVIADAAAESTNAVLTIGDLDCRSGPILIVEMLQAEPHDRVERPVDLLCERDVEAREQIVRLVDVVRVLNVARRRKADARCALERVGQIGGRRRSAVTRKARIHWFEIAIPESGGALD